MGGTREIAARRALATALAIAGAALAPAARAHDIPLVDSCTPPNDPPAGDIARSANVEYVGSAPGEAGDMTAGGRLVGDHFVVTGLSHFSVYDVAEPEHPKLVSRVDFPCRFENEDVTFDGDHVIYSDFATTGDLYVYDVRDKSHPKLIADVPAAGTHTMSCVLGCRYLYGSYFRVGPAGPLTGGEVVDFADPAHPKPLGDWTDNDVLASRKVHDVTEVASGIVITASAPIEVLDLRSDPVTPRVIAKGPDPDKRYHSVEWPRGGRDRFILADFETNATPSCDLGSGDFSTFDASQIGRTPGVTEFARIDSYHLKNGSFADGNPTVNAGLGCSPHWFQVRPSWNDGGVVALGAYDHGVKFLRVDGTGKIGEIGHFRAPGTNASAAYWITCDIVYAVDYTRGLDVLKFSDPPSDCHAGAAPAAAGVPTCAGPVLPSTSVRSLRIGRRGVRAAGTAAAGRCGGRVARVEAAVALRAGGRCRFLDRHGRLRRPSACRPDAAPTHRARGGDRWRLAVRGALPRGRYVAWLRAVDAFGNAEPRHRLERRLGRPRAHAAAAPPYPSRNSDGQAGSAGRALAYRSGSGPLPDARAPEALLWRTGFGGWEPTIGFDQRGTVFFDARNANTDPEVVRSRDNGRTWQSTTLPHSVSLDPYLWVDPATGRVFASDIDPPITCTPVSVSDDQGETWSTSRACGVADHQNIFGGPPPAGAPKPSGYPNVVYYCAISGGALADASTMSECLKTLDGGGTWEKTGDPAYPLHVGPEGPCNGALGHGVTGADGTIYLPRGWCGPPYLAISHDEGATWERVQVSDKAQNPSAHEAGVAIDGDGNLYYVWVAADDHPYLAISRDGGRTWSPARDLMPPGVAHMGDFAAHVDVGEPGRIATVFMGTRDTEPGDESRWNAYMIMSVDALAGDPLFYGAQVNGDANVMHKGATCCGNVGDFLDVVVAPDGTPWAALVDTCPGAEECITDTTLVTPRGEAVAGQLVGGPPLRGTVADQLPPVTMTPPAAARPCRRSVTVRVRRPRRGRIASVAVYVDRRRVRLLRGPRVPRRIVVRALPPRSVRVRVVVRTTTGRRSVSSRRYRGCA